MIAMNFCQTRAERAMRYRKPVKMPHCNTAQATNEHTAGEGEAAQEGGRGAGRHQMSQKAGVGCDERHNDELSPTRVFGGDLQAPHVRVRARVVVIQNRFQCKQQTTAYHHTHTFAFTLSSSGQSRAEQGRAEQSRAASPDAHSASIDGVGVSKDSPQPKCHRYHQRVREQQQTA